MTSNLLTTTSKYLLIAAALSSSALLYAANLNVDSGKSTVHVVFKQMEVPVQARLKNSSTDRLQRCETRIIHRKS